MTTLTDRPTTALLVIDVQNGVVGARTGETRWSPTSAPWWKGARRTRR